MDIEIYENQIAGLQAKLTGLKASRDIFIEVKGLQEASAQAVKEQQDLEIEIQAEKERLSKLQADKANALTATAEALSEKMSEILVEGRALLEISDEGIFIGWQKPDGSRVPYAGLSGGQKVAFDSALTYALCGKGEKILILETAEMDDLTLAATLEHMTELPEDTQAIVNTCHAPAFKEQQEWMKKWSVTEVSQ